jgi:hypothetical protein
MKTFNPMKTNRIATVLALVAATFMLAGPAFAGETGKMNGTVYDPDGVPLAGVTITITSKGMMGKRQTQTSDDGSFLFFGLPPGKYAVDINQSGFQPYKQEDVVVPLGGTASLDVLLDVPTAEETITVTAKRPVVDKEKTTLGQNFDDEFLEEVPIARQYQSVAQLAPGVTGGGNPNIHGGSFMSNQYLVDGINTTDPTTNTFSANINYDAIKEFQIITGGLDAEYGQAMGGVINLVTKSGGNEFHVDTTFYMSPDFMVLKDDFEEEEAGRQDSYQFNLNVEGPIIKDKLWYFASVELNRSIYSLPVTEDFFDPTNPDKLQHPERKWFSVYYLGKLTYQATDKHKLTLMSMGHPTVLENEIQALLVRADAERQRYQGGSFYSLSWEALWSKNLFQKTQVGLSHTRLHIYPMSDCTDIDNEDCRGHVDYDTGISWGNNTTNLDDNRYRLQFDSAWTYYLDNLLGDHEIKGGWQYSYTWNDVYDSLPGGAWYGPSLPDHHPDARRERSVATAQLHPEGRHPGSLPPGCLEDYQDYNLQARRAGRLVPDEELRRGRHHRIPDHQPADELRVGRHRRRQDRGSGGLQPLRGHRLLVDRRLRGPQPGNRDLRVQHRHRPVRQLRAQFGRRHRGDQEEGHDRPAHRRDQRADRARAVYRLLLEPQRNLAADHVFLRG